MPQATPIQQVLDAKGREVYSLEPDASVYEAIELMATKSIGAVLVLDGGRLVGLLSERDYARKVILKGKASKDTLIKEIMSTPVTFVTSDCTIAEAMSLMTKERIRHLPVVSGNDVIGVVSIGDLVKFIVTEQAATIESLHAYISGRYPC